MSYQKFVKDVGLIGGVQALTSLGGFFLLPIITKTLGTYDYGLWSQINITISLLSSFALMGLSMGFIRFLSSEKDKEKIREVVYSILFFVGFSGFLVSFLLYLFAGPLAIYGFKDSGASYFIRAGSLLILLNVLDSISLFYFRTFRQIKMFSYLTLFQTFGKLFLVLGFLLMGYGLLGVIAATLIVQGLLFAISIFKIVSQIGFVVPSFVHTRKYLEYSLPLTPNYLIRWVTDSSDRYLVTYFLGLGSLGVYSAAYTIGSLIQLLVAPLQLILFPEISKLFDENKIDQVKIYLAHSLRYFLLVAIPAFFGLSVLSKPLLSILTTEDFLSGWVIIPVIAFSGLLAGVTQIIINILLLVKKTKPILTINIFAAISNLILNFFLIPSFGIVGAALSTFVSYTLMVVLFINISFKHLAFSFYLQDIAKSVFSSLIMYFLVSFLIITNLQDLFLAVIIGGLIYLFMMFFVGGFSEYELSFAKKYVLKLKSGIRP